MFLILCGGMNIRVKFFSLVKAKREIYGRPLICDVCHRLSPLSTYKDNVKVICVSNRKDNYQFIMHEEIMC